MIRKAFLMHVHPEYHEEYQRRHQPIWPQLEAVLKAHGVHQYSIFLQPETHQLFGYVEVEDEERWKQIAQTEICQKWWKSMSSIMPSNSDHSPCSSDLFEVFHLE